MGNGPEHISKIPGMMLIKYCNITNYIKILWLKGIHICYLVISPSQKPSNSLSRCPRPRISYKRLVLLSAGASVMPLLAEEQPISRPFPTVAARPQVPLDAGWCQQFFARGSSIGCLTVCHLAFS